MIAVLSAWKTKRRAVSRTPAADVAVNVHPAGVSEITSGELLSGVKLVRHPDISPYFLVLVFHTFVVVFQFLLYIVVHISAFGVAGVMLVQKAVEGGQVELFHVVQDVGEVLFGLGVQVVQFTEGRFEGWHEGNLQG
jgi:hypothetical protein